MEPSTIEWQPRKRHLKPRDAHTARLKGERDRDPLCVEYTNDPIRIDKHTLVRPVTAFDCHNFEAYNDGRYGWNHNGSDIQLNKNRMWEDVLDILEKNAIKKEKIKRVKKYCRNQYKDKKYIEYTLPIIGEMIIRDTVRKTPSRYSTRYINFNGKKLDTTMIYTRRYPTFEPFGRLVFLPPDPTIFPIKGKMKLKGNTSALNIEQSLGLGYLAYPDDSDGAYFLPRYEKDFQHIEVDFGKDVTITHLSTMGRSLLTGRFPNTLEEATKYNLDWRNPIKYIREHYAHYVTKFEVQYRIHSSKEWISAGLFTGNNDRITEKRIQFEEPITAQFFRIIPITYDGSPSMNFTFYTNVSSEQKSSDDVDTITYSLLAPSDNHYHINASDGTYRYKEDTHQSRRRQQRSDYSIKNIPRLEQAKLCPSKPERTSHLSDSE